MSVHECVCICANENVMNSHVNVIQHVYLCMYMCVCCVVCRVGQNYIYTVYIRYFWQGNHQIYGHLRCIYTVLANPSCV